MGHQSPQRNQENASLAGYARCFVDELDEVLKRREQDGRDKFLLEAVKEREAKG